MNKLLITAATEPELAPFSRFLNGHYSRTEPFSFRNGLWEIDIMISGVGMMATAFALASAFGQKKYDAAIQAGIAGSFDPSIALGTVVAVESEEYGDLGAEDNGTYIDIFALGFLDKNTFPFTGGKLLNQAPLTVGGSLPMVRSLSVNTVSGQQSTIDNRKVQYQAQIENMEGLAFHYACLQKGIPFLQIRSVSNYVTPRDKAAWAIPAALASLNNYLQDTFATKPA